jgi:thymidylate kinase
MLITFSGLDGAGKTTQLTLLTQYLRNNNIKYIRMQMYDDISTSAFVRKIFKRKLTETIIHNTTGKIYRYDKNKRNSELVFMRKVTYIIDLIIFIIKKVYYEKLRGRLIVMDRYIYDSLANLFNAHSELYINFMLRLIPQPDIAIFLDTEPKVAFQRKPEYPPEFYPERREAYLNIFRYLKKGFIIRSKAINSTHNEIKDIFRHVRQVAWDRYSPYVDFVMENLFNNNGLHIFKDFKFNLLEDVLKKNRIIVRWINKMKSKFDSTFQSKIKAILKEQTMRLKKATEIIEKVTTEFDNNNIRFVVIKTLDNYPDSGHDIDIYTDASTKEIDKVLIGKFNAKLEKPTIAEKIARKRNYKIADFPMLEVHCSRLGEMGEDTFLTQGLIANRIKKRVGKICTYVPKPEYRLLLCVLQRMYRHFNIRICDVYNTINLIKDDLLDWRYLRGIACKYGIYEGVLRYLGYVQKTARYYGVDLDIEKHLEKNSWPAFVKNKNMHFRFPLLSTGISVYSRKIFFELRRFNFDSLARISLVIPLAFMHFSLVKVFGKSRVW